MGEIEAPPVAEPVVTASAEPEVARESESSSERARVAVVLLPRGATDALVADSLTELLIAAVASRGQYAIIGKEEFQAALGRGDAGTLECIESDACLIRMGHQLAVDELVTGTIEVDTTDPDRFRFELYRLDASTGSARGHVSHEIDGGLANLLGALNRSVEEVFVERVDPGTIVLNLSPSNGQAWVDELPLLGSGGQFRSHFLAPGEHLVRASAPGHIEAERTIHVAPGTTILVDLDLAPRVTTLRFSVLSYFLAGGALVTLGVGLGLGSASQAAPGQLTMRETSLFYEARNHEALAANVLYSVAASLLVATIVSLVVDLNPSAEAQRLSRLANGELAWF